MLFILLASQWDKFDDKYAVGSLVVASVFALWSLTGLISVRYLNANFICII